MRPRTSPAARTTPVSVAHASTVRKRAVRFKLEPKASRSLRRLSASERWGPAYCALATPGSPNKASTSRPLSSAKLGMPVRSHKKRAFCAAFSSRREPSSANSPTIPKSDGTCTDQPSGSTARSSAILCGFCVAKRMFISPPVPLHPRAAPTAAPQAPTIE